jgi:CRISPR-associated protein Csx3
MNPIQIKITQQNDFFTLVEISIEGGVCTPDDLKSLSIPSVKGDAGVVITGRAPIWLVANLVHHYHATAWVATFDPRVGGAVVVETHQRRIDVGDIIYPD